MRDQGIIRLLPIYPVSFIIGFVSLGRFFRHSLPQASTGHSSQVTKRQHRLASTRSLFYDVPCLLAICPTKCSGNSPPISLKRLPLALYGPRHPSAAPVWGVDILATTISRCVQNRSNENLHWTIIRFHPYHCYVVYKLQRIPSA